MKQDAPLLTGHAARCIAGVIEQILVARLPVFHLAFGFVFGDPVVFLDLADELVAAAGDCVQMVVGELAPLLLDLAFYLLPVAFDAIPVRL